MGVTQFVRYALTLDLLEGELIDALTAGVSPHTGQLPLRDRYLPYLSRSRSRNGPRTLVRRVILMSTHRKWSASAGVLWVQRAREPNLVHGVFSAAAATRADILVYLLLDDIAMSNRQSHELGEDLRSRIRTWVAFASGDDARLFTRLYSQVLIKTHLAGRRWSAINDYLNPSIGVLDFLVASKVISRLLYTINPEEASWTCSGPLSRSALKGCSRRCGTGAFEQQIGWILDRSRP